MTVQEGVVALGDPVDGDDGGDSPGVGEEAYRGTQNTDVLWVDGDSDRGSAVALAGGSIGVEEKGSEDVDPSGIADRSSQDIVELLRIVRGAWDREGVESKVGFI